MEQFLVRSFRMVFILFVLYLTVRQQQGQHIQCSNSSLDSSTLDNSLGVGKG